MVNIFSSCEFGSERGKYFMLWHRNLKNNIENRLEEWEIWKIIMEYL
ncbi:MAG: hypothetical protein ACI8WT_001622 [Clostridium sp.]|jgi:hypothetical protein